MQNEVKIAAGTLVILSGVPGSGKSTLRATAQGLPATAWVSSDNIREQMFGTQATTDSTGRPYEVRESCADTEVFEVMRTFVRCRVQEGLTTVVDAMNLTDGDRQEWAKIGEEHGAPVLVVIMATDTDECVRRNGVRAFSVPERVVRDKATKLQLTSRHPFVVATPETRLVVAPLTLDTTRFDVVGDVHGLLDDLLALLAKSGWTYSNGHLRHPDNRKLLFLGDMVDRGPDSIGVLRLVQKAIGEGVAIALKGNHEKKLVSFYVHLQKGKLKSWSSFANASSGVELSRLGAKSAEPLVAFMRSLPAYAVLEHPCKIAFVHANVERFTPDVTTASALIHGDSRPQSGKDTDAVYQRNRNAGLNDYLLIRGHIPQISPQPGVFSLERQAFQRGELVLLRLDDFVGHLEAGTEPAAAFADSIVTQKCAFDFKAHSKRWALARGLDDLVAKKLATCQMDSDSQFKVYKYSKRTFWDNLWDTSEYLQKARGIVLDLAGNIESHPFDKCFNYGENNAGVDLPDDSPLVVPDKLNGFLGIVSMPLTQRGKLLIHTQGSFDGDFIRYIKDFLPPPQYGKTCKYLSRNPVTLMFEVIHPEDPHIIEYSPEQHGLWLIGVRGKGETDSVWTEAQIDEAAKEMGFRRPAWRRLTKKELLERCCAPDIQGIEGWMARADNATQEYVFKLKTPHYLVTKFLGRLSANRIQHMYANPADFKKTVDEEFFELVDALTSRYACKDLIAFDETTRVGKVRELVTELLTR